MYLGLSPTAGTIVAIILIAYLIAVGIRAVCKNAPMVAPDFQEKYEEFNKNMGPMTWQERIVSAILIILLVALIFWISSICF